MANENEWRKVEFVNGGGAFHFPPELAHIGVIQNEDPPKIWPDSLDSTFKEDGFVIQFEFTSTEEKRLVPDEPFILEVGYREKDVIRAADSCLQLGLNKNDGKGWRNLSRSVKKKGDYNDPKWIGYWKVEISDWAEDPMVAWGP